MIKWERVEEGECESLKDIPEGAYPTEIEGLEVMGFCENCGIPLLENDRYYLDEEGTLICGDCITKMEQDPDDTSMDE